MKIIQKGKYNGNILETLIENRSVEDVETFLNPNDKNMTNGKNLYNMELAATALLAHIQVGSKISILVDADADGYVSSSIMYQYIKKVRSDLKVDYILHDQKGHGLTEEVMATIANSDIEVLIIPDAGSNDYENLEHLIMMGIEVIIIDHHEVEDFTKIHDNVIIVNNQFEWNGSTNRELVGAGMVLKYCEVMDEMIKEDFAEDFYDLVAIGQIGDVSDISENEIRYMVFKGIENIKNNFVKTVLENHFGSVDNLAPKDFSFSIIPLINAMVRIGNTEEKDLMFRAMNNIDADETYIVSKRKKNKLTGKFDVNEIEMNIYEYTYDICKSVKARQANIVKKTIADLKNNIDNTGGIVIGLLEDNENLSITGLVANKLATKYQKPALLLYFNGETYDGSGRGYIKVMPSLKDWANETGLVEFAQGHANAFGISIHRDNFEDFKTKTKNIESQEVVYEVDVLMEDDIDENLIIELNEYKYLFGGSFEDSLLAFTNIDVDKRFIKQRGQMLTIFHKGVELVMFSAPHGLYEELTNNFDAFITCDFVGQPSINSWKEKVTPQIILTDMQKKVKVEKEITAADLVF